jgi:hypothetical protein
VRSNPKIGGGGCLTAGSCEKSQVLLLGWRRDQAGGGMRQYKAGLAPFCLIHWATGGPLEFWAPHLQSCRLGNLHPSTGNSTTTPQLHPSTSALLTICARELDASSSSLRPHPSPFASTARALRTLFFHLRKGGVTCSSGIAQRPSATCKHQQYILNPLLDINFWPFRFLKKSTDTSDNRAVNSLQHVLRLRALCSGG